MSHLARIVAIASLALSASIQALPSDALLDSLALAAADQEKAGVLSERDHTEALLETLSRQRVASDSSPERPKALLAELDRLREERARKEAEIVESGRKPSAEVQHLLEAVETNTVAASSPEPVALPTVPAAPVDTSRASRSAAPAPAGICPSGAMRVTWASKEGFPALRDERDSIFPIAFRIDAPCGLTRIDLFVDETLVRRFPVPTGNKGAFEFSDGIALTPGLHRIDLVACDSLAVCTRSAPFEVRSSGPVPPWIPKTVGVLVGLCVLLGLTLVIRKRSLHPSSATQRSTTTVPLPESSGVSSTIRHRLQLVAKEIGPNFPAVSLRLPDSPPALAIDPESLGEAFGTFLRLHARRSAQGGQILIAMGHGPMNAELVFEDTAPSPDEQVVPQLLDAGKPRMKERMELDQELESARQAIVRSNGSVAMESRIDGGLRTRIRLRLAPRKEKA